TRSLSGVGTPNGGRVISSQPAQPRVSRFRLWVIGHMARSPLVDRELRGAARRPLFYWLRGVLALATGFQACELLDHYAMAPRRAVPVLAATAAGPLINGAGLLHQMSSLLFLAVLFMGLLSADSITRERRDGTLGLLLLTDLTPAEIVRGKMLSCGLTSFLALLGCLPALMLPVLAGGVTGSQAALTGIGLLNTLFVSLTAGLWMSAVFRERRHAIVATLGLVGALAFGPEVLGGSILGLGAVPWFRLFGLAGWMTLARLPILLSPVFACWLAVTHAVGWLFLWRAAVTLAATWQDQPHQHVREPEAAEEGSVAVPPPLLPDGPAAAPEVAVALPRASWLTDPRPWDADPIRWRVERLGSAEGLIWMAVALDFFAQFGLIQEGGGVTPQNDWRLLPFLTMVVIMFCGGLLAWAGARFFQDTRRQQDLELLLTTPLGARCILAGQWRVLRRALRWPVGLVLGLVLPAGISVIYDFLNDSSSRPWSLLQPCLIAVNLALEAVALSWVGMKFGLRNRNLITAVAATVGLVQLLPLALTVALMPFWAWLQFMLPPWTMWRGMMTPGIFVLLLFMVKNLSLIVWARFRLRRDLRL
ncbi:MAG: ABC transporter permease subunit, partial [Verrucomicrobia bacterium]|nr:ABC transporter permease subunit [Verrucomicrobiota bacterium]